MTPWDLSVLAWVGGGVIGAVVAKNHRIAGAALGAIVVGAVSDKLIEKYHPQYTGGMCPRSAGHDLEAFCAKYPQFAR
jgi:hypothetical protein